MANIYSKVTKDDDQSKVLVLNCGSSSVKLTLFDFEKGSFLRLCDAHLKEFNTSQPELDIETVDGKNKRKFSKSMSINEGLELIFEILIKELGVEISSIRAIGHRFVHGGNHYRASVLINDEVIEQLEKLVMLAPLHNESCLLGIKECIQYFGKETPEIAVFDTAFFSAMPDVASSYAIPQELSRNYEIKRYGFHGISYAFVYDAYMRHPETSGPRSKIIAAHLGNGCSMSAIREGKALDTSMGFTPAEGLVMGTRAGDIDASVVQFLCEALGKSPNEVMNILNFDSGLLGISQISSSMKDLLASENVHAKFAIELFCYRAIKYFGAYIAVLKGVDSIIFSGGIGENSAEIREKIIEGLDWYGVSLDRKANDQCLMPTLSSIHKISAPQSTVSIFVIATDENQLIAKESVLVT